MCFNQAKQGCKQTNNNKNINKGHADLSLLSIFDPRSYEKRKPYSVNDSRVEDPGVRAALASSGMTAFMFERQTARGFTLIELLVVVLIIGILAAVALPQYQLATAKVRYMQLITLANALRKGQDAYRLANGHPSDDISALDIELPSGTSSATDAVYYSWGFCRIGSTGYAVCESTRDNVMYNDLSSSGLLECKVKPNTNEAFGKKLCESMGFAYSGIDGNGFFTYQKTM